ncbi:hypothetical protein CSC74_12240 [Pseudoxanthomonas yeongjuensis]|nr:hypothetical protein CSC74_12240 [Pseudoxanthomonas yeongjuensis]
MLKFDAENLPEAIVADFTRRASKLVLEMDAHRPWLLKEPRLCLLLPLWRKVLEVPVCVQIFRNPIEVAASLHTRNEMPIDAGLALWEHYVRSARNASTGLPNVVVLHRQLMQEPMAVARQLLRQLESVGVGGMRLPSDREISAFVRDDLYRERESRQDLFAYTKAPQMDIFRHLMAAGNAPAKIDAGPTPAGRKALAKYESGLPPLKPKSSGSIESRSELVLRGQLSLREQEAKLVREMSMRLDSELKQRDSQLAFMETEFRVARESAAKLDADLKQARERLSGKDQELRTVTQLAESRASDLEAYKGKISIYENESRAAVEEHARLTDELRLMDAAKTAAEASVSERFREIEQLTMVLINREQELERVDGERRGASEKLRRQLSATNDQITKLKGQLLETSKQTAKIMRHLAVEEAEKLQLKSLVSEKVVELKQCEDRLAEITGSIFWRIMKPLRAAKRLFSSGGQPVSSDLNTIRGSGWFDADWYLKRNQDVARSGIDPAEHYLNHGAAEGRDPGPEFDAKFYLATYADVAASKINPLLHYMHHGKAEGRSVRANGAK